MRWTLVSPHAIVAILYIALLSAAPLHHTQAASDTPSIKIVTTIKPLDSLVQMIAGDTAQTTPLAGHQDNPHHMQLSPSKITQLHQADVLFLMDSTFETFMLPVLGSLPRQNHVGIMGAIPTLDRLPQRNHKRHVPKKHIFHDHADHHYGAYDPHFWLNVRNAQIMLHYIAGHLSQLYPEHKDYYAMREEQAQSKLHALDDQLHTMLAPLRDSPYLVLHDAYYYLEHRYGLKAVHTLLISSNQSVNMRDIDNMRYLLSKHKIRCLFREPHYSDAMITRLLGRQADQVNITTIDPLGMQIEAGEGHYTTMMLALAGHFADCLNE